MLCKVLFLFCFVLSEHLPVHMEVAFLQHLVFFLLTERQKSMLRSGAKLSASEI